MKYHPSIRCLNLSHIGLQRFTFSVQKHKNKSFLNIMIQLNAADPQKDDIQTVLELDIDLHNPTRLSILMFLLPRGRAPFTIIQKALGLTSGNLSSHIKKLQTKGFIEVKKKFIDLKPTTVLYLSIEGRKSIVEYASNLSSVLQNMLTDEEKTIK
ncbi:MAG: transcriptional regulator [Candidatus Hodarchaeota archaeon]